MKKQEMIYVGAQVPKQLTKEIQEVAKEEMISQAALMRRALSEYVKKRKL